MSVEMTIEPRTIGPDHEMPIRDFEGDATSIPIRVAIEVRHST